MKQTLSSTSQAPSLVGLPPLHLKGTLLDHGRMSSDKGMLGKEAVVPQQRLAGGS